MLTLLLTAVVAVVVMLLSLFTVKKWLRSKTQTGYIIDWFKNHRTLVESDKDNLAVIIKQSLANGKVRVIFSIFNIVTEEILDGEQFEAEQLDEELEQMFGDEDMIVVK